MTDQSITPPAIPAVPTMKADAVVQDLVIAFPELGQVRDGLLTVIRLYAQYLVAGKPIPASDAANEIRIYMEKEPADILEMIDSVDEIVTAITEQLTAQLEEETGREIDPQSIDIVGVAQEELDEQKILDTAARDIRAKVTRICTMLDLKDLWQDQQNQTENQTKKKPGLREKVLSMAMEHNLWEVPAENGNHPEAMDEPNWLTPPVLDSQDQQYMKNVAVLDKIIADISANAADPNIKSTVLDKLASFGKDAAFLESFMYEMSVLAAKQLDQSSSISKMVEAEKAQELPLIGAIKDLKHMYQSLKAYLLPEKNLHK